MDGGSRSLRVAIWTLCLTALLLAAGFGLPAGARADSVDNAVSYQLDANHDGYQSAPITAPLTQAWTAPYSTTSAPLIVNGVVYVSAGGTLYALEQATGSVIWSDALGGSSDPLYLTYDAGSVFVLDSSGVVTAVDATSGATLWTTQLSGQSQFQTAPVASTGIVYITGGGAPGTIYAISEDDGGVLWSQPIENGAGTVALDDAELFSADDCGAFNAFNAFSGFPIWSTQPGCAGSGGTTPVADGSDLYVPAVDASPGAVLSEDSGSALASLTSAVDPAVANGVVYSVYGDSLSATSAPGSGTALWPPFTSNTGNFVYAPLVVGNLVFDVSSGGTIYALDTDTGNQELPAPQTSDTFTAGGPNDGLSSGENTLLVPTDSEVIAYTGANVGSGIPANMTAPTVVGTPLQNQPVGADVGVWSALPTSYSYQWLDCDSGGCNPISGANGEAYTPTPDQVGTTLEVSVTATNSDGSSSASISAPSNPVDVGPPQSQAPPSISGSAVVGSTLTASPGSWSPAATDFTYQWLQCSSASSCSPVGAPTTSNTYLLGAGDEGMTIAVEVAAGNADGAGDATSAQTAVVTALTPTTMTLSSSANPANVGDTVTFTAKLSTAVDGGTLSFSDNGTPISGCSGVQMNLSVAYVTCSAPALASGTHAIGATYTGDAAYGPSSAGLSQVINVNTGSSTTPNVTSDVLPAAPVVKITSAPSPTSQNTTVSYMVTGSVKQVSCTLDSRIVPCSDSSAVLSNLSLGPHTFKVIAGGRGGQSAASISWTTELPLAAPHALRARRTPGGFTVSWTTTRGAKAYRLTITLAGHTTTRRLGSHATSSFVALTSRARATVSLVAIGAGGVAGRAAHISI